MGSISPENCRCNLKLTKKTKRKLSFIIEHFCSFLNTKLTCCIAYPRTCKLSSFPGALVLPLNSLVQFVRGGPSAVAPLLFPSKVLSNLKQNTSSAGDHYILSASLGEQVGGVKQTQQLCMCFEKNITLYCPSELAKSATSNPPFECPPKTYPPFSCSLCFFTFFSLFLYKNVNRWVLIFDSYKQGHLCYQKYWRFIHLF